MEANETTFHLILRIHVAHRCQTYTRWRTTSIVQRKKRPHTSSLRGMCHPIKSGCAYFIRDYGRSTSRSDWTERNIRLEGMLELWKANRSRTYSSQLRYFSWWKIPWYIGLHVLSFSSESNIEKAKLLKPIQHPNCVTKATWRSPNGGKLLCLEYNEQMNDSTWFLKILSELRGRSTISWHKVNWEESELKLVTSLKLRSFEQWQPRHLGVDDLELMTGKAIFRIISDCAE